MAKGRLQTLREQRAALDARIKAAEARLRNEERKKDTRRKVLAGAAVLHRAEGDPAFRTELMRMLDGFLSRHDERVLFDLPDMTQAPSPLDESAQAA